MRILEHFLEERVEKSKEKAYKLIHEAPESEDDLHLLYSFILARRYSIPLYSEYFKERTFDELAFEVYLWKASEEQKTIGTENFELDEKTIQEASNAEAWEDLQTDTDFLEQARADFADRFNQEQPVDQTE